MTETNLLTKKDVLFRAIADPTRRAMLDMLSLRTLSVNQLAAPFDMSQPAVTQHLRVLEGAGLVSARKSGRHRIYRLRPKPLLLAFEWIAHYERFWGSRLDALGDYLNHEKATETKR